MKKTQGGSQRMEEQYRKKIDLNLDLLLGELERENDLNRRVGVLLHYDIESALLHDLATQYQGCDYLELNKVVAGAEDVCYLMSPAEHLYEIVTRDDVKYLEATAQRFPAQPNE